MLCVIDSVVVKRILRRKAENALPESVCYSSSRARNRVFKRDDFSGSFVLFGEKKKEKEEEKKKKGVLKMEKKERL
jgi:hypothetical protein